MQDIETKFPSSAIKSRRGAFGKELIYVSTPEYIRRLNSVFDYKWDWRILDVLAVDTHVSVKGELKVTLNDTVVTKHAFGGSMIKRNKKDNSVVDYGADLKSASSDALKKACSLLGIGLHLWDEEEECEEPQAPKTDIKAISKADRVSRVIEAFKRYGVGRDELEDAVGKPDAFWDENDFNFLREEVARANKANIKGYLGEKDSVYQLKKKGEI